MANIELKFYKQKNNAPSTKWVVIYFWKQLYKSNDVLKSDPQTSYSNLYIIA